MSAGVKILWFVIVVPYGIVNVNKVTLYQAWLVMKWVPICGYTVLAIQPTQPLASVQREMSTGQESDSAL